MLEAYSTNQTLATGTEVPFNSVSLQKGTTAILNGVSTIQFNNCGVYEVTFDFAGTPSEGGELVIAMEKSGLAQAQALINIPLVATTLSVTGSKTTFVQVPNNNCNCPCVTPTTISFVLSGVGLANANFHVTVQKI